MNQQEWFQIIEQEKPGTLRKVWEDHLCLCTKETNEDIARDLSIHARMRGDDVVITVAGWRHYRTQNGFVSYHRQQQIEESPPIIAAETLAPTDIHTNGTEPKITSSRQAIAALESVVLFLKNMGGFGIQYPAEPMSNAIETLFGQHHMFMDPKRSDPEIP